MISVITPAPAVKHYQRLLLISLLLMMTFTVHTVNGSSFQKQKQKQQQVQTVPLPPIDGDNPGGGCTISGVQQACQGQTLTFTRECGNASSYQWYIGGTSLGSGLSVSYTFETAGYYYVVVNYMEPYTDPDGFITMVPGSAMLDVTIEGIPAMPTFVHVNTEFCESASSVTLTLQNPEPSPVVYSWTAGSTSLGTGNSKTLTNVTVTTPVTVWASTGGECGTGTIQQVIINKTELVPQLDPSMALYHKRTIRGTGILEANRLKHYWQTSSTGTSREINLVADHQVTELGTYYIRSGVGAHQLRPECWATASAGLAVTTMNYTPPEAFVVVTQKHGYNEVIFLNGDKAHILKYADYYWVSGPSSTTIVGEHSVNGVVREWRKYANGTYYLRGKDRGTGTWGPSKTITITILGDNDINWVHTKSFDGGAVPQVVGESKSYFDDAGKPLQTQTRNLEKDYVLATQSLRDQYDRVVGTTLPAPLIRKDLLYNDAFFLNEQDRNYAIADFDGPATKLNPNKAGAMAPGTLGWYYSSNNTWESNVDVTYYPYSRNEFYEDGTGEVKRSASPGDQHRLGAGHETLTGTFPVVNELDDYYSRKDVRVQFSNTTFMGGTMGAWQNFNPLGGDRVGFQWLYEGTIGPFTSGTTNWSSTTMLGQQRPNGLKWPAGMYVVRVGATNNSVGGISPFTSGLSVYASDTPGSSATHITYTGDGSVNVGSGKIMTLTFTLSQPYEYLLFMFDKWGPSSGYSSMITMSTIEILSYNGIPQGSDSYSKGIQTVGRDVNGKFGVSVTDKEGKTVMVARKGSPAVGEHVLMVNNKLTGSADPASGNYRPMLYFYILDDQPVTITDDDYPTDTQYSNSISSDTYTTSNTSYVAHESIRLLPGFSVTGGQTFRGKVTPDGEGWSVENIVTGERLAEYETFTDTNGNWPAGFYRVLVHSGTVNVSYKNYFQDVSYQFYDDMGRLKTSVSPNGYKKWIEQPNPATNFPIIDKTTYTYNFRGWLLSMTEPDAGTSTYQYRKDGKIRFSQNAQQANTSRFSYTHYDDLGRPVESGEYKGTAYSYATVPGQLEYSTQVIFPAIDTKDWIKTVYDNADANLLTQTGLPSSYVQEFLRGGVSYTENENNKTWYSYDEFGRVNWMAQKPKALNRTFVSVYRYDFLGNVTRSGSLTYAAGVLAESFYHHYEYDKDKRLQYAYTSTDGTTKTLRAAYDYYLHGPLKRVELGNGVQGIDFVYNIHGWLTQINHPSLETANDPGGDGANGVRKDVFGMAFDYYESEMEDLFPTASLNTSPTRPEQFHRLPLDKALTAPQQSPTELAGMTPQLVMPASQQQWTNQVRQIKDYFTAQKRTANSDYNKQQPRYVTQPQLNEPVTVDAVLTRQDEAFTHVPAADFTLDEKTLVASASKNIVPTAMPAGIVDDAIELAALKQFYDSLGGVNWTNKSGWPTPGNWPASATAAQMDLWMGIVVSNGDIVGISMSANNVVGKIPAAISQLAALTTLSLQINSITGKIPVSMGTMPALQTIDLRNNQLTGGIPSQLGSIASLKSLRLASNPLGGSIPTALGSLSNLETLELNSCSLTGTITPSLKKLHKLLTLNLSSNPSLTGDFPPLGQLTLLQSLTVTNMNGMTTGPVPAWLDSLRNLVTLNLDYCKRNGSIPGFIGNLTSLQTLALRNNQLTGSIPAEVTNLTALRSLLLNNNQLTGSLPANMGNLALLQTVYLYSNQLSGSLPPSLFSITTLSNLQLNNNQLSGSISEDLGNLTALTTLDLSANQFSGEIPRRLGNITPLTFLNLSNNSLTGEIPGSLKTLVNVHTLYFNHNQLTGEIPNLGTLNKMQYLQVNKNKLTGKIGSWIGNMNLLRTFRIDENMITEVDAGLMSSPQLTNVYLGSNALISVPNFYTYSNKANLNLYMANNYLDFSDLEPLFGTGTHGIKAFGWSPQKKFSAIARIHVPAGETLELSAPPKGTYSTVTWEKQSGSSWVSVNASNEDATQQTYRISNATSAVNGNYRWRMTNTRVTGLTLESQSTEVTSVNALAGVNASGPALYNGMITSARWQTETPESESSDPLTGMYIYQYDEKYQVKEANWAEPNYLLNTFAAADNKYRVTSLAYDPNGNIQSLARFNEAGIRTNNFTYAYEANKNKLTSVSGHVSSYTYNAIGQLTDEDKDVGDDQHMEYDVSGKVVSVSRKGISSAGLIGDYQFQGNGNNSAGGMGNATVYNGVTAVADRNSQAASAYQTDGVDDYLTLEDPEGVTSFKAKDFTVTYWVKRLGSPVNNKYSGINKWNFTAGSNEWNLSIGSGSATNYPAFMIESGSTTYAAVGTTSLLTTQWYHLAGVRQGEYIKIYVNGQLQATTYVGSAEINTTMLSVYVGRSSATHYTNAIYDDIKIYNRALSNEEVSQQVNNETELIVKARYAYDDRGFRLSKTVYPNATASSIGTDVKTTWYIRDAGGTTLSVYEQDGEPNVSNSNPVSQTEVPVYGAGKLGTYYPAQDGSVNYEITDHLGNVRALVRDNVNIYTATMEDDGTTDITNPRVSEMQYFQNLFETEQEDYRFNHTQNGEYSAYLYWIAGSASQHKALGPAMTLKVNAGDTVNAEAWVRYENKLSYSRNAGIATMAALLSGNFSFTTGFEGFTMTQTTTAFSNALTSAGFMGDGVENDRPFAYINYILFNESMAMVDAGWQRVDESAGFDPGQEGLANQHVKVSIDDIVVPEGGYIYVWVSNESEGTKVWFDDIKVTHTQVVVTQSTDYGVWGDVLRELKSPDFTYRHGYQGNFSEKDEETGWNHFELREYDAIIGRWTAVDPKRQHYSPYLSNGNNPINRIDPDGGSDGLFGRLVSMIKNWWNSAIAPVNDDEPIPTEYEDRPKLISMQQELSKKASAKETLAVISQAEITPYVSISVGKEVGESGYLGGYGSITLTRYGLFYTGGLDATIGSPSPFTPGTSLSLSGGLMFGPRGSLSAPSISLYPSIGTSYGAGFLGVEGSSNQIGVVLSTSPIWGSTNASWTIPDYRNPGYYNAFSNFGN